MERHVGLVARGANRRARKALAAHGSPLTVPELLDGAVLRAREVDVPAAAATYGFTWEPHDSATERWYPQGITTTADADPARTGGRDVVVVSWYAHHHLLRTGSRLTFVDLATLRYRHVLLVRAIRTPWGVRAQPVPIHAGGIAWFGPYLYVAATRAGIEIFRIDDLLSLSGLLAPSGRRGVVSRVGDDAVLPLAGRFAAWSRHEGSRLRYSFLSVAHLDDGRPWLVAGEYGGAGRTRRLCRFPLDPARSLPVVGRDGRVVPEEIHSNQAARMQGVTAIDDRWYVTTSQGRGNPGDLLVGHPGAFTRHRGVLPTGCEDITAWPERRQLWSTTEWPGMRWVYAMDATAWTPR